MQTHLLGFSRMGKLRELKRALETYWKGEIGAEELIATGQELRARHWKLQRGAGIELLPVGDFSCYDHMLDMTAALGAVPARYGAPDGGVDLDAYFQMARGGQGVPAMEMSKWFDTNYHYIVPELAPDQRFSVNVNKLLTEIEEAKQLGGPIKAVLPGPITFCTMSKSTDPGFDRFELLSAIVEAYEELLGQIGGQCDWIQLDEPVLAQELPDEVKGAFNNAYDALLKAASPAKAMLATYFGSIAHNLDELEDLPLHALHVDLVRAPGQLDAVLESLPKQTKLSLGVVNGRNIWKVDADKALEQIRQAVNTLGSDRIMLAPSCSLLHVPVDLEDEPELPTDIKRWMAFGVQKCQEVGKLAAAATGQDVATWLDENRAAWDSRRSDPALHRQDVRERIGSLSPTMYARPLPYAERRPAQRERLGLPLLPTTTIGSFPQTTDIRAARRDYKRGDLSEETYLQRMRDCIRGVVNRQEELGLDVLVHGEPERNDMVEYFGEQLDGFCFTNNGWVQSYGSRCVKPPVIYGDVARSKPMTVTWSEFAQSLTDKPMKGMLTGPVTILCWSFVRDDQPRSETCRQIALAIRDEVADLEQVGLGIIQVDEPALREGAPLRVSDWDEYFRWAVDCFRLAANVAAPETQIHTHMCYCDFNDIIEHIAAMDADVISLEASRSRMELLEAFRLFEYPNEVGPGIYDIHSPRVPSVDEMANLLRRAVAVLPVDRLWANPDCGLKTRGWEETTASLRNMVEAARIMRQELRP
ncbi:5-methyltetrahydropteroyltriglutamate--homocysteine S-methyltransferase [Oceanidesulfovibrio indonesiensis]|uniref:5-methyltetrahydropteroyltriglutamate--homocysteine methyltransferase n=1 Tax=Oceanidesulfovibrio indonesiensis TaxID=54767 RepID=A0A7M3MEV8_9BACT|nr:5-methyltetrahydropteroyltriglutamate--homocysteine S-methyltransferase [Oceanidesulfovibrio indonesiensis]TVM17119.1 5-methyltetrahydropteroyltriglutamate--homocysteine S-methyltransferase [Oceanidesulfovibrio indonesiensis]